MDFRDWCELAQKEIDQHLLYPNLVYDQSVNPLCVPLTAKDAMLAFEQSLKNNGRRAKQSASELYNRSIARNCDKPSNFDVRLQGPVIEGEAVEDLNFYSVSRAPAEVETDVTIDEIREAPNRIGVSTNNIKWITPADGIDEMLNESGRATSIGVRLVRALGLGHWLNTSSEKVSIKIELRKYKLREGAKVYRPTFLSQGVPNCFCCDNQPSNNFGEFGATAELGTGDAAFKECLALESDLELISTTDLKKHTINVSHPDFRPNLAKMKHRLKFAGTCTCEGGCNYP